MSDPMTLPSTTKEPTFESLLNEFEMAHWGFVDAGYADDDAPEANWQKARDNLDAARSALLDYVRKLEADADRWRALLPTLTVRNVALAQFASAEDVTPAFARCKTWLESKEPIEGVALNPTEYADALLRSAPQLKDK